MNSKTTCLWCGNLFRPQELWLELVCSRFCGNQALRAQGLELSILKSAHEQLLRDYADLKENPPQPAPPLAFSVKYIRGIVDGAGD